MTRLLLCALAFLCAAALGLPEPAHASPPAPAEDAELQAVTAKMNAYVALMNRTLRASESIERYESWVDMEKGPVNKNRVFGVYELHDVTALIAEATEALKSEPALAGLDPGMKAYIEAYTQLAPIIDEANTYYERKEYLDDDLARGKQIHARLAPAAKTFLAAREKVEEEFGVERTKLAQRELAAIERLEGRKARWHRTHLLTAAQRIVERLPSNERPVVDVAALDADVAAYAEAVKAFNAYRTADPRALASLQGPVDSLLAASRAFRDALKPVKGDARRGGGQQLQAVVNAYNALAGSANNAAD